MKIDRIYKTKYFEFTPRWSGFNITYHVAGYFEPRAKLQIYIIWGCFFIYLPWKHYKKVKLKKTLQEIRKEKLDALNNKKYKEKNVYAKVEYDTAEPRSYGIYIYNGDEICFRLGDRNKSYDFPWHLDWVRTSALDNDGEWLHETKHNRHMEFYDKDKWKDILLYETHPYKYTTKYNEIQECLATIRVQEREWRWKWFKWLKYTKKVHKSIDIEFSQEMGEKRGSFKGGTLGCSYEMKKDETPYETLKRMELERKFD